MGKLLIRKKKKDMQGLIPSSEQSFMKIKMFWGYHVINQEGDILEIINQRNKLEAVINNT